MKQLVLTLTVTFLTTVASATETLSLADYLKEVEAENLGLKASRASADAADARSVGIALPEPMVGYMQMKDESGSANGIEISQTIPFPTKLSSDHSARRYEAEAEKVSSAGVRKSILAQARLLYFNTWAAQTRIQYLKEKRSAIQQHLRLSTASTRSDSSLRIHTLKAESDFDLLESEILEAEQSFKEKQIQLAAFAKRDPNTFQSDASEPSMAPIPSENNLSSPFQLEFKRLNLEMLGARESEAKSSWFPDFNLRYREFDSTTMTPGYSEVMVGVSVPFLFFWEPNAKSKSATAERLKAEAEYHQEKVDIVAKTASLRTRAESLKKQINLIQSKLLPRAEKRMRLVHNLAPRDMETLSDHREAMEEFPNLKLKALDLRTQFEEVVAQLSSLTPEAK